MRELKKNQNDRMQFIDEGYLRNHTLFPNTTLEGYILIPFNRKVTDIDLVLNELNLFDVNTSKVDLKTKLLELANTL